MTLNNKTPKINNLNKKLLKPMQKDAIALKINNPAEAEEYTNILKELDVPFDNFLLYLNKWDPSFRGFLIMRDDCFFLSNPPDSYYLCKNFNEFLSKLPQKYKKNMKAQKHKIEITTQEAAYLCAILNNPLNRKKALDEGFFGFMLNFDEENGSKIFKKFKTIVQKQDIEYISNSQHLFAPEIEEFRFSCGLGTKTEKGQITIGCQVKTKENWLAEANSIIALNLQEVKKEDYTFTREDVENFRSWLIQI